MGSLDYCCAHSGQYSAAFTSTASPLISQGGKIVSETGLRRSDPGPPQRRDWSESFSAFSPEQYPFSGNSFLTDAIKRIPSRGCSHKEATIHPIRNHLVEALPVRRFPAMIPPTQVVPVQ